MLNNSSDVLAQGEFRHRFPSRPTPTGQTGDVPKAGQPRSSCSAENIAAVAQDIEEEPIFFLIYILTHIFLVIDYSID